MRNLFIMSLFLFGLLLKVTPAVGLEEINNDIDVNANAVVQEDSTFPIGKRESRDYDPYSRYFRTSIIPMVGTAGYLGNSNSYGMRGWNNQVYNQFAFGLGVDIPVAPLFSTEVEGGFAQYTTNYALPIAPRPGIIIGAPHVFNQWNLAVDGKFYFVRHHIFRPYVGLGLMGLYYEDMMRPMAPPPFQRYNQFVGAGQAILGADVSVSQDIGIGIRGALVQPLFNLPMTANTWVGTSAPGYEDAAIINSAFYKLMGTVRVNL